MARELGVTQQYVSKMRGAGRKVRTRPINSSKIGQSGYIITLFVFGDGFNV